MHKILHKPQPPQIAEHLHLMSLMPLQSIPLPFLFLSPLPLSLEKPKHEAMSLTLSPSNFLHSPTRTRTRTHTSTLPKSHIYPPSFSKLTKPRPRSLKLSCTQTTAPNPPPTSSTPSLSFRSKPPKETNILVVGSTGYIGRFVIAELCRRGYNVLAVARERSGIRGQNDKSQTLSLLRGSTVLFADVTDPAALDRSLSDLNLPVDAVVCCLASRNGGIRDSWNIDYSASKNSLVAGRRHGASHFVLLSAICVQKPLLEFQRAKLKFEAELMEEAAKDPTFNYSIVRPTAFFKSLAGQVELVKDGKPYVMFGDGKLCACKPISEEDLARFIADCVVDEDKMNRVLPVGGPGKALTPVEQGEMLFRLLGKEPKFLKVPIGVMDFAIGVLGFLAKVFPGLADAAEFGRIGRYYAAESMLVLDPETGEYSGEKTPSYGKDTLEEFFERVIREGMAGQELGEQTIF